ncbi:MAG: transposase, partial [Gallionellaceae bacterium]
SVKKVVKILRRHEEGLLNFSQHTISNACAEVFNSAFQSSRRMSVGSQRQQLSYKDLFH